MGGGGVAQGSTGYKVPICWTSLWSSASWVDNNQQYLCSRRGFGITIERIQQRSYFPLKATTSPSCNSWWVYSTRKPPTQPARVSIVMHENYAALNSLKRNRAGCAGCYTILKSIVASQQRTLVWPIRCWRPASTTSSWTWILKAELRVRVPYNCECLFRESIAQTNSSLL